MPTREQAGVYVSVKHYLAAVKAAGTTEAQAVAAMMRTIPVERFGSTAIVRPDGRVVYDIGVYEVVAPEKSKGTWDFYRKIADIPGAQAFRPLEAGGCSLVGQADAKQ